MSMNYYLGTARRLPRFEDEEERQLHIGLSCHGWVFFLHVIPELGISSLEDWRDRYHQPCAVITDDAGAIISAQELDSIITERQAADGLTLRRNDVGRANCVGHGDGPWQLNSGEFC